MCTIMTFSRDMFLTDKHLFIARILKDSTYNCDGWNLVAVDPADGENNIILSTMKVTPILTALEAFMLSAGEHGRVWIHSRAATTDYVGVEFNHGFSNYNGILVQHNGIVTNYRRLAVDSYNLTDYTLTNADTLSNELHDMQEFFANIFLIRPLLKTYGVVRQSSGSLYTDGEGNYSTNTVAGIDAPVATGFSEEHSIGPVSRRVPVPAVFSDPYDVPGYKEPYAWEEEQNAWDMVANKYKAG